jgi:hypothetical protein
VASKLGPFVENTLVAWVNLCFAINGKHVILLEICSKEGYLHLQLYCNNEGMFKSIVQRLKVMNIGPFMDCYKVTMSIFI